MTGFPVSHAEILQKLEDFEPEQYARTRNYLDGGVSRLSPYISRGVLSLPFIFQRLVERHGFDPASKFIYELAWREFFQRVWANIGDEIFQDIKQGQLPVRGAGVPESILSGHTGIQELDRAIRTLYDTGYMHNHARLWIASVHCNIARRHWRSGANWMYYHLLDGDPASNSLGWQWVAGTFSHRKYLANQESINRYAAREEDRPTQSKTFLDHPYEKLGELAVPYVLTSAVEPDLPCELPARVAPRVALGSTALLYHPFHLDPNWHPDENATRILVLDPKWFARFPVSPRVLEWILSLARGIPDLQIFAGDPRDLDLSVASDVRYRIHPCARRFPGTGEAAPRRLICWGSPTPR